MSGILDIMNSPGVYQSSMNNSQSMAIENAKRQAETERLLQQAQFAREEQPYDLKYKDAMTQELLARAQGTGHYQKITPEEKAAKAEEIRRLMQMRQARGSLETARTLPEGRNEYLEQILGNLPPEIRQRLAPNEKTRMFNDDNINSIIQQLREEDPEAGKFLRTETQGQDALIKQREALASRERIAEMTAKNRAEFEKSKAAAKTPTTAQALAVKYSTMAQGASNAEEKAMYLELARDAYEHAGTLASASAVQGTQTKAQEDSYKLYDLTKGKMGTKRPDGGAPNVRGTGTAQDPIKLD